VTGLSSSATSLTLLLVVSDVARSRDWYVDVLGAEVHREYGGTSCVLKLLDGWILLVTGGGPTDDKPTVTFEPPSDPDRMSSQMIFGVSDCRRVYEDLRAKGADLLSEPVEYDWEIRAFFRDPDGHLFEISQPKS